MEKAIRKSFMTLVMMILTVCLPQEAFAASEWTVNPADYRYDMSLYFSMSDASTGEVVDCTNYEIAVFAGDECRGVANPLPEVDGCSYMRIRSNSESGESLTFKIKNRASGLITEVEGVSLAFESGKAVGLPSNPFKVLIKHYFNVEITAGDGGSVNFENGRYEEGSALDIIAVPDEGFHFVEWSDGVKEASRSIIVNDNLSIKANFSANTYKLTYIVDGEIYNTLDVAYGTAITPETAPEKEGYTFSGWNGLPETMPAHDVEVSGSFTANTYKLTYIVDGEIYKTLDVAFGAAITPEAAPEKEGYTFSGWVGLPETMPAHDVEVSGSFTVNTYKLTYIVDGETYRSIDVAFGAAITAEAAPEKEGYTFSGWVGLPETMPAHDVEVSGSFTVNAYKLTYIVDGETYRSFDVAFGTAITPEAAPEK